MKAWKFLSEYLQSVLLPGDRRERKVPLFVKSVFEYGKVLIITRERNQK